MELESCHFFYAYNFEVASRCLEVLWTPGLCIAWNYDDDNGDGDDGDGDETEN